MKPTEIKDKIVERLKKYTIDDYYADSELNYIREMFKKLTHLKTDEKIKSYLDDEYYKTNVGKSCIALDKELNNLNKQIIKNDIYRYDTQLVADYKEKKMELKEKKEKYYKDYNDNEYSSLQFLLKLLLPNEFYESEMYREEPYLVARKFNSTFVKNKPIIPKEWRKILYHTFSKPISKISGIFDLHDWKVLEQNEEDLTNIDISTLIALKIASRRNMFICTEDKRIILVLSGGIIALITFREKGEIISKFQKKPVEIFINRIIGDFENNINENHICYFGRNVLGLKKYELKKVLERRFVFQALYHQSGYANGNIEIPTPNGYYILTDKYVIEIYFEPAPILFDSNSIVKFAPNISSKAKLDDEAAEEERRREWNEEVLGWDNPFEK